MDFGWALWIFLCAAAVQRLFELRHMNRAVQGQRKATWLMAVLHTLYGLIYIGTAAEYVWLGRKIAWPVTVTGLGFFAVGLALRTSAIRTLGKFWSVHLEIRNEHRLVTEGIYRHVRHPAYLGIMLEVAGIPLVANSYYTLLFALAAYVPALLLRWHIEEREMIQKFGERYEQYRKTVPAFLPLRWPRR